MIVTCPGCAATYRVRNEAVPDGGAKMRCPRCGTVFLALAPVGDAPEPARGAPAPVNLVLPTTPGSGSPFLAPPTTGASAAHRASTDIGQLLGGAASAGVQASSGAPHVAIVDDKNDPFANLDLSAPPTPSTADSDALPVLHLQAELGQEELGQEELGQEELEQEELGPAKFGPAELETVPRVEPSGLGLSAQPIKPKRSVPRADPAAQQSPTLGMFMASWIVLIVGLIVFAGGGTFAAWTVGIAPLDGVLMPFFEKNFDVVPPVSSLGHDAPDPVAIRQEIDAAIASGDLVAAATGWRRLGKLSEDALAKAQLEALLAKLQHQGLLD